MSSISGFQKASFVAVSAFAMLLGSGPASAAVRYDFVANNSFVFNGTESISGSFSYTAATFVNPGNGNLNLISVPAAALSTCSAQSTSGLATVCKDQWFMREISPNTVNIGFGVVNNNANVYVNYYFAANAFTTAGVYNSILLGPNQSGTLIVTNLNAGAVPEPSTWAMLISGFGLVGFALRTTRRRAAFAAS